MLSKLSVTLGTFTRAHHTHSNTDKTQKQCGMVISYFYSEEQRDRAYFV